MISPLVSPNAPRRLRDSPLFRLTLVGALILALLIPLGLVRSLIGERQGRHLEVVRELASNWGPEQSLRGPLLVVPYVVTLRQSDDSTLRCTRHAVFLPESLTVRGELAPERRHRGMFEAVLYRANLHFEGTFARPDLASWEIGEPDVRWQEATLAVGIPDLRGLHTAIILAWQGAPVTFSPGGGEGAPWPSGIHAKLPTLEHLSPGAPLRFAFDLELPGSEAISFLPLGRETVVQLQSTWPAPSFQGPFLPDERTVTSSGFDARWRVSYFGRAYPQQWLAEDAAPATSLLEASAFGVGLYLPADAYQKTERSAKYGILFLVLTFLTFFLFEVFHPVALHPVQYLLVGSALCLFYLLLLSLSEQLGFGAAYAIAASAVVTLIGGYARSILGSSRRSGVLVAVLGGLYGFLYVLLQAEDYALLMGTVGLFAALAATMFLTRRVDWSRGQMASPVGATPLD